MYFLSHKRTWLIVVVVFVVVGGDDCGYLFDFVLLLSWFLIVSLKRHAPPQSFMLSRFGNCSEVVFVTSCFLLCWFRSKFTCFQICVSGTYQPAISQLSCLVLSCLFFSFRFLLSMSLFGCFVLYFSQGTPCMAGKFGPWEQNSQSAAVCLVFNGALFNFF